MKLMSDGVYVMYKLGVFNVTGCLEEILQMIGYLDKLDFLLNVYTKHCRRLDPEEAEKMKEMKRSTLSAPGCTSIINIKRWTVTKFTD